MQERKTRRQRLSRAHYRVGRQRGFKRVERDDVTESFSYAVGCQVLMDGRGGDRPGVGGISGGILGVFTGLARRKVYRGVLEVAQH